MLKFTALIISAGLSFAVSATSGNNTVGQVYEIVEPDALAEIEQRVRAVDWTKELNKTGNHGLHFRGFHYLRPKRLVLVITSLFIHLWLMCQIRTAMYCIRKAIPSTRFSLSSFRSG